VQFFATEPGTFLKILLAFGLFAAAFPHHQPPERSFSYPLNVGSGSFPFLGSSVPAPGFPSPRSVLLSCPDGPSSPLSPICAIRHPGLLRALRVFYKRKNPPPPPPPPPPRGLLLYGQTVSPIPRGPDFRNVGVGFSGRIPPIDLRPSGPLGFDAPITMFTGFFFLSPRPPVFLVRYVVLWTPAISTPKGIVVIDLIKVLPPYRSFPPSEAKETAFCFFFNLFLALHRRVW